MKIIDQTANGTGSLSIEIKNTPTGIAAGIYTQDSLAEYGVIIESGTVLISLMNNQHAHGIRSGGIYIHGGQTTITNTATDYAFGVYAAEDFDMTGGSVSATVAGSESGSCALMFFNEAYISGGYGVFRNTQSGYGAIWGEPVRGRVSGHRAGIWSSRATAPKPSCLT